MKKKLNIYAYLAVVLLSIYSITMTFFLLDAHRQIKGIYTQIENRKELNTAISEKIVKIMKERSYYINDLDYESDDSISKFVSSEKSFNDIKYIPENLVGIESEYVSDLKGGTQLLRKEANVALQEMGKAFYKEFDKKIAVVSAYRSYDYQAGIKSRGCSDNMCAKAGYSEHQSGLAIDLWEASTEESFKSNERYSSYYDWLSVNAHIYGFTNTYQRGLEVDTYEIEPWHWRFVGQDLATYLRETDMTIAEFYKIK